MPRRLVKPDSRLSWRDPSMPVLRDYTMPDGSHKTLVDEDYERRYREHLIETDTSQNRPHYKTDPTYDMKRKRHVR